MAAATNGGPGGSSTQDLVERVQALSSELEHLDAPSRAKAEELVAAIIELYGQGLERIFELLDESEVASTLRERLAGDGVVASLMLIHGLYPVPLDERVMEALDGVRPYMESHGGNVELLGLDDGVATIRLEGSCDGCPASSSTLELAIKQALDEAAPDLEGLIVEGAIEDSRAKLSEGALELPMVTVAPGHAETAPAWHDVAGIDGVAEGELRSIEVAGLGLVVSRVDGVLLAYRDVCPGCDSELASGTLVEGLLACPACERSYFLPRAGRSVDEERLQLQPVPLLVGSSGPRVALAA